MEGYFPCMDLLPQEFCISPYSVSFCIVYTVVFIPKRILLKTAPETIYDSIVSKRGRVSVHINIQHCWAFCHKSVHFLPESFIYIIWHIDVTYWVFVWIDKLFRIQYWDHHVYKILVWDILGKNFFIILVGNLWFCPCLVLFHQNVSFSATYGSQLHRYSYMCLKTLLYEDIRSDWSAIFVGFDV